MNKEVNHCKDASGPSAGKGLNNASAATPVSAITGNRNAAEQLASVLQHHEALLAAVPDIIMEVDSRKVYKWANQAGIAFFGDDVIGREASFYFEGEQNVYDTVSPVFGGDEHVIYVESWQRRRDGQRRLLGWWCRAIKDEQGAVKGAISTARDITERKRAEETLQRISFSVESASDALFWITPDSSIVDVNPAACRSLGYTREELLQLRVSDIDPHYDSKHAPVRFNELRKLGSRTFESEHRARDGRLFPVEIVDNYVKFGSEERSCAFVRDISDRKLAEEALRLNKELLSETELVGKVGGWSFNIDTMVQTWTDEVYRIHEVEISGNPSVETGINYYTEESRPIVTKAVQRAVEYGEDFDLELEIITAKGNKRSVNAIGRADLKNRRIYGFFQDITERKRIADALAAEKANLDAIFEASPVAMMILDESTNIVNANAAALLLCGGSAVDVLQHRPGNAMRCAHSTEDPRGCGYGPDCPLCPARRGIEGLFKNGGSISGAELTMHLVRNGKPHECWIKIGAEPVLIGGRRHLCVAMEDITSRKRTEEKLRDSEAVHSNMIANIGDVIVIIDRNGINTYKSPNIEKLFGWKPEDVVGCSTWNNVHPDDLAMGQAFIAELALVPDAVGTTELRYRRKDGSYTWIEITVRNLLNDTTINGFLGNYHDISERKRAEDALRASEKRFTDILYYSGDAMLLIDGDKFVDCNEATVKMLGYNSRDEFLMSHPSMLSPTLQPDGRKSFEKANEMMRMAVENGYHRFEWVHRRANGEDFPVEVSLTPIIYRGKLMIHCLWRDVSAQRKIEQEYQTLFREMLNGFALHEIICDELGNPVDYRFLALNPAFEKMTGLKAGDIVGRTVLEVMPGTEKRWIETYGNVALSGEPVSFEQHSAELGKFFNVMAFRPCEGQFTTIFEDITERKMTEDALRESETQHRLLIQHLKAGVVVHAPDTRIMLANEQASVLLGLSIDQMKGKAAIDPAWHFVKDDETVMPLEEYPVKRVIATGQPVVDLVLGINRPSTKDRVWVLVNAFPELDVQGRLRQVVVTFIDITERKMAEDTLRKKDRDLGESQRLAKVGSWYLNVSTNEVVWSPELYRLYGADPSLPPPPLPESMKLFTPESWEKLSNAIAKAIEEKVPYELELQTVKKDGSKGWMWTKGELDVNSEGKVVGVWGAAQDISERKMLELYRDMGLKILEHLNGPGSLKECIGNVLATLKTETGFDAVGIRMQDGLDFPYLGQEGFSHDFLLTENTLVERGKDGGVCRDKDGKVKLECTCGLVISGKTNPSSPLFTKGGSFWTNDSFPLLDLPSGQDPRLHPRNNCIHQGYGSVALIPIRVMGEIHGLLQLNDKRKGRFTAETIAILENVAAHIGSMIIRKDTAAKIAKNEFRLRSLVAVLQHQSEDVQTFLDYALSEAIQLTGSKIGYIYFYSEETKIFTLNTWSRGVMEQCNVPGKQNIYDLDKTGIWGEAVRQRKEIIVNEFHAPHPLKKGYPQGHAPLHRFLTVPVFSANQIVAVVGVANKESDYDNDDVLQLELLMDGVWKEADRKRIEYESEALREFLDSVAGFGFAKDIDLKYVSANRAFCDLLKIPYDKIRGMTDHDIFPADLAEKYIADDRRVIETALPITVEETTFNAITKQRFVVQTRKFPRLDKQGNVIGVYGMGYDITKLKQAEDALRRQTDELRSRNVELERFNRASVGRELRMIELKQEINDLCRRAGMTPRYEAASPDEIAPDAVRNPEGKGQGGV